MVVGFKNVAILAVRNNSYLAYNTMKRFIPIGLILVILVLSFFFPGH
jgi:hypothetical protein